MNKALKEFIRTSGIFFIGSALSKVIVFLLLPLYTNYISTISYGYYDLSVTYSTVLTSMVYFDIWATALRFLYEAKDGGRKNQVATICWAMFAASSIIFLVIGGIVCSTMDIAHGALILGYGLSLNLLNISSFIARGWKKNIDFAISGIINTVVMVLANLVMILGMNIEIEALYISAILGNVVQVVYLSIRASTLPKIQDFRFDRELFLSIVRYTLPLCINSVSYWLLTSYNRTVIQSVMGLSANGIYAIGNKFGAAISLVTTCFTYAWQDMAFTHQESNKADGIFFGRACGQYFFFLGLGVAGLLPFFYIAFPILIGEGYAEAYTTIPLFLIMALLSACSAFVGNVFYAIKDTRALFNSMIISCLCNMLLCRPLIANFGINGANASICVSFALNIGIRYSMLARRIAIKHQSLQYAIPTAVILIAVYIYLSKIALLNIALLFSMGAAALVRLLWMRKKQARSTAVQTKSRSSHGSSACQQKDVHLFLVGNMLKRGIPMQRTKPRRSESDFVK